MLMFVSIVIGHCLVTTTQLVDCDIMACHKNRAMMAEAFAPGNFNVDFLKSCAKDLPGVGVSERPVLPK